MDCISEAVGEASGSGRDGDDKEVGIDEVVDIDNKPVVWANDEESLNRLRRNDPDVNELYIGCGRPENEAHHSLIDWENDGELVGANSHLTCFALDAWGASDMKRENEEAINRGGLQGTDQ